MSDKCTKKVAGVISLGVKRQGLKFQY